MAKSKKSAPKKAAKKSAAKVTVKHVQEGNNLVENDPNEGLTEQQKVSNVITNKAAS